MTLQDLISSVETNLGDRASGVIGDTAVSTVILNGVNFALPQCVKLANPTYYDKTLSISVASGSATKVTVPSVTVGTSSYRVKDIVHVRTSRAADGTPVTIQKVPWDSFMEVTRNYDQQLSGIPSFMSFREGSIYFDKVPAEAYTVTLFVEVWPRDLTTLDLNVVLPIDPEWALCVEAYTTYYCYLKMQQKTMAVFWEDTYEKQKKVNSQVKRKTDIRGQGTGSMSMSGNVWLNPFINKYNTPQ